MFRIGMIISLICVMALDAQGQSIDSIQTIQPLKIKDTLTSDTIIQQPKSKKLFFLPADLKPSKVAILSAIIPGLGQAYNRKYWKLPLVYGALGATVYFTAFNTREYRRFRDIYIKEIEGLPHEFSGKGISLATFKAQRDYYQKNKELSYLSVILVYSLNILDAFVDAHLMTFDVSEDLSMTIIPTTLPEPNLFSTSSKPAIGLSIAARF